jgi:hypothetical protein
MTANIFSSSKSRFFFSETTGNLSSHHHRLRHARARVHRQVFFSPFQSNRERSRFKQSQKALVYRATPKKKKKKEDVCVEIDFLKSDSHHAEEEKKNAPIHIQEY